MKLGIRSRFALWLLVVLVPVCLAGAYVFAKIEDQVSERVATDLESVRRLEASRISSALSNYADHAKSLASGAHVVDFTSEVNEARDSGVQTSPIAGYDVFDEIDAFDELPLQQLVLALQSKTQSTGSEVHGIRIVSRSGDVLGSLDKFEWEPDDPSAVERAMSTGDVVFGNAFRNTAGADLLGVVVPIMNNGTATGALLLEDDLGPVVDLVVAHEGFGRTSEAHIVQMTADGRPEFITPLRFVPDAAFTKVDALGASLPVHESLASPDGSLLWARDYRGADSVLAVQTIDETGWGLVIKVDRAEALEPILARTRSMKTVALVGVIGLVFGWAVLLDPIGRRLREMALAAERMASGEYETPLADRSSDEIGSTASSIDRLANDLAVDIAIRSEIEAKLRRQATHDETTGLFNRQYATALLRDLSTARHPSVFSLLFMDMDDFKVVNDTYGHNVGDSVLRAAALRIDSVVADAGAVARWGGDEFVVVLDGVDAAGAAKVACLVERAFEEPIATNGGVHHVRVSIGSSTLEPGESLDMLLHDADGAMFEHKQARSGRRSVSPETVRLVEAAFERNSVEVWYQPIVAGTSDGFKLSGCEALVRVRKASGEVVGPAAFLDEIQQSHLGRSIDRHVIRQSLCQVAQWMREGWLPTDFKASVNCGEALMRDIDTAGFVRECLQQFGLGGKNLMIEVTENASVMHPQLVQDLSAMGVRVAVDDLGLSHSNMDRLLDGGAHVAKIDRRWLPDDGDLDTASGHVIRHLISLCHALDLQVVAEGIETQEQLEIVRALGVTTFQGFLFSRPITAFDFAVMYGPGLGSGELALAGDGATAKSAP